jgi:hypothetical protein
MDFIMMAIAMTLMWGRDDAIKEREARLAQEARKNPILPDPERPEIKNFWKAWRATENKFNHAYPV